MRARLLVLQLQPDFTYKACKNRRKSVGKIVENKPSDKIVGTTYKIAFTSQIFASILGILVCIAKIFENSEPVGCAERRREYVTNVP